MSSPRITKVMAPACSGGKPVPCYHVEHESIAAMVGGEFDKETRSGWAAEDHNWPAWSMGWESDWFVCRTLAESKADILAGWPDGVAKMKAGTAAMGRLIPESAAAVTERMETAWDVAGDDACIGRYLDGEPECMGTGVTVTVPAQGRVVSLVVKYGASASVDARSLAKVAIGIMAIIDALESTGLRCEVKVVSPSMCGTLGGDPISLSTVTMIAKHAEDAVDMGLIASALHPDTYRRYTLYWAAKMAAKRPHGEQKKDERCLIWQGWEPPLDSIAIDLLQVCNQEPADWVPARMAEIMKQLGIEA